MELGQEISLAELKTVQVNMLKHLAAFCDSNDIRYFLAYGTLIGAVRHGGYIPWDDDIDVALPRQDYEKLLKLYNTINNDSRYFLLSPFDDKSRFTYAKLFDRNTVKMEKNIVYNQDSYIGVDIDLFPIDRLPGDYNKHIRLFNIKKNIYTLDRYSVTNMPIRTLKGKVLIAFCKAIGHKRLTKAADFLTKKYINKETGRSGIAASLYNYEREWHKDNIFSNKCKVEFEGQSFWAPHNYHDWLTDIYGDYMQLPPETERTSTHEYSAYWRKTLC